MKILRYLILSSAALTALGAPAQEPDFAYRIPLPGINALPGTTSPVDPGPDEPTEPETGPALSVALINATVNRVRIGRGAGSATAVASGGKAPYHYALAGNPPSGVGVSATGSLTNTPDAPGNHSFAIAVTDSSSPPVTVQTDPIAITVLPELDFSADTVTARVGEPFEPVQVGTGNAAGSVTFSNPAGTGFASLSAVGLGISPSGLISGTPSSGQTIQTRIVMTEELEGRTYTAERSVQVAVTAPPALIPRPNGISTPAPGSTSPNVTGPALVGVFWDGSQNDGAGTYRDAWQGSNNAAAVAMSWNADQPIDCVTIRVRNQGGSTSSLKVVAYDVSNAPLYTATFSVSSYQYSGRTMPITNPYGTLRRIEIKKDSEPLEVHTFRPGRMDGGICRSAP